MINIVTENIITFTRLPYSLCKGYRLIVTEIVNGSEVTHEEPGMIENPKVPTLVSERKELDYNYKKKWSLPSDAIISSSDDLKVWINNILVNTNSYTYSPNIKMLEIGIELSKDDLIEIEYNVDRISLKRNSMNETRYTIIPVFHNSHHIGQHTVL